jgi:hypothetical protein
MGLRMAHSDGVWKWAMHLAKETPLCKSHRSMRGVGHAGHAPGQLIEVREGASHYATNISPGAIRASQAVRHPALLAGDVSGDGTRSLVDSAAIKNLLLEAKALDGKALARGTTAQRTGVGGHRRARAMVPGFSPLCPIKPVPRK